MKLFDPYAEFESAVLKNGIHLHTLKRSVPWSLVSIITHAGAEDDPIGKEGVAHFVEHMDAKDREHPDSMSARDNALSAIGLQNQGFSTDDLCTQWNVRIMPQADLNVIFKKIAHHWFEPLPESRFMAEQKVIEQEYHQSHPSELLTNVEQEALRVLDPRGRYSRITSTCGNQITIRSLTFEDLQRFHQRYYQQSNISIVYIGSLSQTDLLSTLENADTRFVDASGGKRNIRRAGRQLPQPLADSVRMQYLRLSEHNASHALNEDQAMVTVRMRMPDIGPHLPTFLVSIVKDELLEYIRGHRASSYDVSGGRTPLLTGGSLIEFSYSMIRRELVPDLPMILDDCLRRARKDITAFEQMRRDRIESLMCIDPSLHDIRSDVAENIVRYGRIKSIAEEIRELKDLSYESYRDAFKWLTPEYRHTLTVTR